MEDRNTSAHDRKLSEKRAEKQKKASGDSPTEKREVVMHGAKLKCPHAKAPGDLKVTSNEINLQDQLWATEGDGNNMVNLQFKGTCGHPKWPAKNMPPPPCMSVIKLSPWENLGTSIVQTQTVLVKESFITCDPDFNAAVAKPIPTVERILTPEEPKTEIDYKFLVNFRRGNSYKGEYGFDWLREEYIEPLEKVLYNNSNPPAPIKTKPNGKAEATKTPLCENFEELKTQYRPFVRFQKDYYCTWLSIFPVDYPNSPHINGVKLDIEVFEDFKDNEKLKKPSEIEIHFECDNADVEITPKIAKSIKEAKKGILVKCTKALSKDTEITVKAVLKDGDKEKTNEKIGKFFIYANNEIKNIDISIIDCLINDDSSKALKRKRGSDLETYLNSKVLNQALIQCKVKTPEDFDLRLYKENGKTLVEKYSLDKSSVMKELEISSKKASTRVAENSIEDLEIFRDELMSLYEKNGANKKPVRKKNDKNKFMFFANIFVQMGKKEERFFITKDPAGNESFSIKVITVDAFAYLKGAQPVGNTVIFFTEQTLDNPTIAHEFGHNLGLWHLFDNSPYRFYKGHTDNFMDYSERVRVDVEDSADRNRNTRLAYYKWQWDEMRKGI
ncbi:protein of unknown function [Chryseobacterium oleae]|uniref:DUF4280 domain-containing protein n=2 Tax=Chryseobacterium oleae TaxID=491207 RepID=A0A1I4VPU8_CHROL|nr:protein of unknown function [Chryseobacterium oleae]